jgi:uncharacterized repeat protein (TIGR01451 family)
VPGGQNPHLAITKVATETSYGSVGDIIHYTIVATNDGNTTLAAVTVSDPKVSGLSCTPANGSPLAPGASMTCTATHTITAADITAGHYANTACVNGSPAAQACASADVPANPPTPTGQITPTGTSCTSFNNGTATTLSSLSYSVKSGKVGQVSPGVFFYWIKVTATAGSNTFHINQAITTGNFDSHFFNTASGSFVYNSGCTKVNSTISQSGADTTITFNAASAGTYIIGVKYDSGSVTGFTAPSPTTTVHYTFQIPTISGSLQGLDLVKK